MEDFSKQYGIKLTAIGQMAVQNRHAYDRLNAGTAHQATADNIVAWINDQRVIRGVARADQGVSS